MKNDESTAMFALNYTMFKEEISVKKQIVHSYKLTALTNDDQLSTRPIKVEPTKKRACFNLQLTTKSFKLYVIN